MEDSGWILGSTEAGNGRAPHRKYDLLGIAGDLGGWGHRPQFGAQLPPVRMSAKAPDGEHGRRGAGHAYRTR